MNKDPGRNKKTKGSKHLTFGFVTDLHLNLWCQLILPVLISGELIIDVHLEAQWWEISPHLIYNGKANTQIIE